MVHLMQAVGANTRIVDAKTGLSPADAEAAQAEVRLHVLLERKIVDLLACVSAMGWDA